MRMQRGLYDVIDFSKRVLVDIPFGITNLKLQKLMYFIYGTYYCETDKELFNERPQAWDYGPVFPKVFYKYRSSAGGDIDNTHIFSELEIDDKKVRNIKEAVLNQLADKSDSKLIGMTHIDNAAWSRVYKPGVRGILLDLKDIKKDFAKYVRK